MADRPSSTEALPIPTLGGLNERPSPANLQAGQFDVLEGLYPKQIGLLARIPGKTLLAQITGKVLSFGVTNNVNGDILIQTTTGLYAFTLDELRSRATTPSLTFASIAEEETMSMAIIVQREANTVNGGSIRGFISGTDSGSSTDTFYPRRLTNMLINESSTVSTFTAAGSGAGAASSGSFTLVPGVYRITCRASFSAVSSAFGIVIGLWNATAGAFEVQTGGTSPNDCVIATAGYAAGTAIASPVVAEFDASITVSSTNKTFEIRQKASGSTGGLTFGGAINNMTGANVGGAAALNVYCWVKILKVS